MPKRKFLISFGGLKVRLRPSRIYGSLQSPLTRYRRVQNGMFVKVYRLPATLKIVPIEGPFSSYTFFFFGQEGPVFLRCYPGAALPSEGTSEDNEGDSVPSFR